MAVNPWDILNAQNENKTIPQPAPQPGLLDKANNFFNNLAAHLTSVGMAPINAAAGIGTGIFNAAGATANLVTGKATPSEAIQQLSTPHNIPGLGQINGIDTQHPFSQGAEQGFNAAAGVDTAMNLPGIVQGGKNILESIKGAFTKAPELAPKVISPTEATLASRIKDATPSFNKDMIGTHVMTPDVPDAAGKVVKGQITPRIAEENLKLKGERPVTTSASEHAAGTELNNIKNYPDKGTALQKSLAVEKTISQEAEGMRGKLQAEDKASPLDAKAEKAKLESLVKENLPKDIQDKIGYIGKDSPITKIGIRDNPQTPLNKALQDAMGSPEDGLPKTAAGRYYQKVLDEVKAYNGTREGKLNLRQSIDNAYKNARGKLAFGSDSQNALDEVHSDIRDAINQDLKASTKNVDTQASLEKQTKLYNAKRVLDAKAKAEASNTMGRFEQKHPATRFVKRQLQRKAVSIPLTIGATAAGVPLATAAARKLLSNSKGKAKALK